MQQCVLGAYCYGLTGLDAMRLCAQNRTVNAMDKVSAALLLGLVVGFLARHLGPGIKSKINLS